jgi:glycosyltransferase involved in cell wall biosynthesis
MATPSVLFINRVYPPGRGATGRVLRDMAQSFAADGWNVTVLTTGAAAGQENDGPVLVRRISGGEHVRTGPGYIWIWLKLFFAMLRMTRRDLVITMTDPPMLVVIGRIYASIKGTHHIHWCQDLYPDLLPSLGIRTPKPLMHWLKKLSRRSMKTCDRVVVIGRCMAKQLTYTGVENTRVTFIPNWPDFEILDPSSTSAPRMHMATPQPNKELLRDESPKFRVLYAGNIGRAHPMKTIVEAAALLAEHTEIEFVFVGDSPGHEKLAKERDKRGLENIKFLSFQPTATLRTLLESGDVHLVTLREQAAGMMVPCKFYSTMAVGRPCIYIGPEGTEIAKVLGEYQAGSIVPQGDAEALRDTILSYRHDPDKWFVAQQGAIAAGRVFVPQESIPAFLSRARNVVENRV